jgi:hypothetical protein
MGCRLTLFLCVIYTKGIKGKQNAKVISGQTLKVRTTFGLGNAAKLNFCATDRI